MDRDEAEKKIREAATEGRVKFAGSEAIEQFGDLPYEFLSRCLGVRRAWISDESSLSDFGPATEAVYAKIESEYGADVRGKDNLVDILRVIHAMNLRVH